MNTLFKQALGAALFAGAMAAPQMSVTAAAQVNGIATVDLPAAVASSNALQTAYQQIGQQYATQRQTISERQQTRQQLMQSFDFNSNGALDDNEAAAMQDPNNATVLQIQTIDQEIATLQQPINLARVYVVQQVAQQYSPAVQQVITARNVQFILDPGTVVYQAEGSDITGPVVDALNALVPAVNIIPPADFQPSEASIQLFQQVQQLLTFVALQQQQQAAAAAQQEPAASGR
ncbi:OmpH family outer membrane protein [Erythrobacter sp. EC-HK427]|uniref:OmpH family outer membrane protein n=1 Tax=Erythrobacter sp. EC-HK427 TaxID=2038396 RepID=UPI00125ADD50|nr:OmpH family outer membrane protein [Erythrobacter sp. EC-HK427]VVT18357.1 conserved exported hypothetical protein [Erythrobacter sp. EC-HK427]